MNKIKNIYENIKENNEILDKKIHIFFHVVMHSDLEKITDSRFTTVFIIKMLYAFINGARIDSIINEIRELETTNPNYKRMKQASVFTGESLSGLWHKHYEQVGISSMALNIRTQIRYSKTFLKDFCDIFNSTEIPQDEKIKKLGYLSSGKQYLDRIENGKLTGEWIIYHKHKGKNYYLNIGKHDDGDDILANEIRDITLFEFPFLKGDLPIFD